MKCLANTRAHRGSRRVTDGCARGLDMRDQWWQFDVGEMLLFVSCAAIGFLWGSFALGLAVQYAPRYPALDPAGLLRAVLLWPVWAALGVNWGLHRIGLIGIERGGQILFSGTPFIGALMGIVIGSLLVWRLRAPLS